MGPFSFWYYELTKRHLPELHSASSCHLKNCFLLVQLNGLQHHCFMYHFTTFYQLHSFYTGIYQIITKSSRGNENEIIAGWLPVVISPNVHCEVQLMRGTCQNQWEKLILEIWDCMLQIWWNGAPAAFLHGQSRLLQMNYSGKIRHFVTKHSSSQSCCRNIGLTLIYSSSLHSLQISI